MVVLTVCPRQCMPYCLRAGPTRCAHLQLHSLELAHARSHIKRQLEASGYEPAQAATREAADGRSEAGGVQSLTGYGPQSRRQSQMLQALGTASGGAGQDRTISMYEAQGLTSTSRPGALG